jgi:hypothetical protein
MSNIKGLILLTQFYLKQLPLLHQLPKCFSQPDDFLSLIYEKKTLELQISPHDVKSYNEEFELLKRKLRDLGPSQFPFKSILMLFAAIRLACCFSAVFFSVKTTVLLSVLQFVVAPYSLFAAVTFLIAMSPSVYFAYYVSYPLLYYMWIQISGVLPFVPELSLVIDIRFILCFFVIDQAICTVLTFYTPAGKTAPRNAKPMMWSVVYGFFNCKTFFLVLLFSLRGFKVMPILCYPFIRLIFCLGRSTW